jgi:VanZ family protein
LAARFAHARPRKSHVALPVLIMIVLYGLSSLPGLPLPDDPAHYALIRWVPPAAQNALHVPAYATLSLAWSWALRAWLRAPAATLAAGGAIASAYGVLDEWHQSFVPGRYASLVDVLLDVLGAALGSWLAARLAGSKDSIPG